MTSDFQIFGRRPEHGQQFIPLHFNVLEHSLPLEEFIIAAKSTESIIEDFNQQFFGGNLKYQIIVLPPEAGTFKQLLGLNLMTAGAIFVLGGLVPEFSSGVVKGLTGKSVFELGELVGQEVIEITSEGKEYWQRELVELFLTEAAKGFFQKEERELFKCGLAKEKFIKAYESRNNFYEACYRNPDIHSIGFTDTDEFPIKRSDFPRFIVDIPENEKEGDDNDEWVVEITHIRVTSTNWERGDNRLWKAKYHKDKEALFSIEDELFWGLVETESLKVKVRDSIKVQWAFMEEGGKRKKFRVLRILEYNGKEISTPLSDEDLDKLLNKHSPAQNRQIELFS